MRSISESRPLKRASRVVSLAVTSLALLSGLAVSGCGDEADDETEGSSDAISVPDKAWTYVPVEGTFCRDGSQAGIALSTNKDSKKLMIFLEGGGACFDTISCLASLQNITPARAVQRGVGVFDRANPANPVADWNFVYVPYCTGDVFSGANPNGQIEGEAKPSKFVGYTNMGIILKKLRATFPQLERVLLTGVSAGGFGASANVGQVIRAFPEAQSHLIDDSGPGMSSKYLTSCLQDKWRTLWNLDETTLKECGAACTNPKDFVLDYSKYLGTTYTQSTSGLIETTADLVITRFFGSGLNDCTGSLLTPVPDADFEKGLIEWREAVKPTSPNFGTYFIRGNSHTVLELPTFYTTEVDGVKLTDWVRDIVTGTKAVHVGPQDP